MVECGIVSKVEKNMAWVNVAKGEHCQGCTACSGFGQGSAQLIAKNELAAQPGETVEIEIDPKQVVKHSAIVFLLPVAGLIFGYFLGAQYLIKLGLATEGAGIVGSFGLLILTIIGIHFYDRTIGKSSVTNARIIRRV